MNSEADRIIVLSGQRGIGKSTVCKKVSRLARDQGLQCGGFVSYKSSGSGIIIEDVETGKTTILAGVKPEYRGPQVGQYYFSPEGIEFGIKALERGLSSDLLFIDELGHLEVRGEGFAAAFNQLEQGTFAHALVVIREELLGVLLPRFKTRITTVLVTAENRDNLGNEIASWLTIPSSRSR